MTHRLRTPALEEWVREIATGDRTPTQVDPLHRAACAEANALEVAKVHPELAQRFLEDARRILEQAAREQQRGTS